MKSVASWLAALVSLSLMAAPLVFAQGDEVTLVEPLNVTKINLGFTAAQTVYQANPVCRPETICGNPSGDPNKLIKCYEFAMMYVTYQANGEQVLHLPLCNSVSPFDPNCETSTNLCAGNTVIDPFQNSAPICGEIRADVLPITSPTPLTLGAQPSSAWDGVSVTSTPPQRIWVETRDNGVFHNRSYRFPILRLDASLVQGLGTAPILAAVVGRHTNLSGDSINLGFFNPLMRVLVWDQTIGDIFNTVTTPMVISQQAPAPCGP